jgi:3-phosphoshikimate 1-carboxyvinyltransferase
MTIDTLARRGVEVEQPAVGRWRVAPGPIKARDVDIEPDLSNAAPFLVAALVAGGSVTITGWPSATTQVGAQLEALLPRFGARVERDGDRLTVHAPEPGADGGRGIRGVELDLSEAGELVPNLVALAAFADEPSTITGIGHIRHHETDRLAALAAELNGLGGRVTELDDGLRIEPAPLHGGGWKAYADHRMATTGAIVGLAVDGVVVDDIGSTSKTLPQFTELWERMLG